MLAGEGPRRTAWSASLTWRESGSQPGDPPTPRIPSSRQGRMARQAISPRFAMKMLPKYFFPILSADVAAGEDPQRLPVLPRRVLDHVGRKLPPGGGLVPRQGEQVVADELLVEALLGTARPVFRRRPEPGGIGSQRLVDPEEPAVQEAELEFRVGDDDPLPQGVLGRLPVERQGNIPRRLGRLPPQAPAHPLEGDVHVVLPLLLLGGGGEERLGEPGRLDEPRGEPDAAHLAMLPVFRP